MSFSKNNNKKISKDVSLHSITVFSIILFFMWMLADALVTFQQFTLVQVLSVGILSVFILLILIWLFARSFFRYKPVVNIYTLMGSVLVSSFLILLANNVDPMFSPYVHTYPLLETELKLGWHIDTTFHVSIIQSILNFGYPSTGQHGTPFIAYHVLSHYIDAGIIYLTGVQAYDSYGLLFHFKIFMLLSSILIFILYAVKKRYPLFYAATLIFATPVILGTWHLIGSHGLSFTSLLIIMSSIWVFHLLYDKEKNSASEIFLLFLLIIFVALGKISSGFMYAVFIGFYLLLKQSKDIKIYLLGISWIIFFIFYKNLMMGSGASGSFLLPDLSTLFTFITDGSFTYYNMPKPLYASLLFFTLISFLFKNKNTQRLLLTSFISFLVLMFITLLVPMSKMDMWYFQYALSILLNLFLIQALFSNLDSEEKEDHTFTLKTISIVAMTLLWLSFHYLPKVHFYKQKRSGKNITQVTALLHNEKRPLYHFRKKLFSYLKENGLEKDNVVLFIPKEIYEKELKAFGGSAQARGMLMYALTGVPLANGVKSIINTYGYDQYGQNALWVKRNDFDIDATCKDLHKSILIVENFRNFKILMYNCSQNNSIKTEQTIP